MDYKGKKVKLLLHGNLIIEGVVKSWNSSSVHLVSLDGKSTSIITHPNEDIRVIKVIHDESVKFVEEPVKKEILKETEIKFKEAYEAPSDDKFRLKNLIELRKELNKQEREIIANKLSSHQIGEVREVKYEQPGFFKKQSAE